MAEDERDEEETTPEEEGGIGWKKITLLVVICLLLVGASVVGTMFALGLLGSPADEVAAEIQASEEPEEEAEEKSAGADARALYFPLKPAIVVNFQARGRQRFLQAEVTLMTRDRAVIDAIETHMPMIRNSLILLFGGQEYEELQTVEGKENLRQQALVKIQELLEEEIGKPGVEQVLFTNLVMQ